MKDKTEMKHSHIVYYNKCPEEQCNKNYIGETGRRISEMQNSYGLLIKQLKPTLHKQEKSIELKLFNWHHVYAGFSDQSPSG